MKAMVLAAGLGLRLRPLTETIPKALVAVAGRPMIEYSLLLLRHYGIREIIINLHYLGEQIETYLGNGQKMGLRITYSREMELLDTGGGLLKAKPFLAGETFIVINTDVLIDLSLRDLLEFHREKAATATLVLRSDEQADHFGSIDIDGNGCVCRFLDTMAPVKSSGAVTKLMFTGVQVLEPKIFDYMESHAAPQKFSTTKNTFPRMVTEGAALYGFRFEGFWQDLGTPARIKQADERLVTGHAKLHYL
jgi:mannose-1-phosphate guanylyltransferase